MYFKCALGSLFIEHFQRLQCILNLLWNKPGLDLVLPTGWFSVRLLIRHIASNVNNANGYRVAAELHVNPPAKQINTSYLQYTTTVGL